ncbi:MAG: ComEC/Rec2 family competence protein [Hyphomicrobiales bacterium]|nr:ComEC/Rec2 family competence protein [Hyphomicrobiales bacterium]
MPKGRGPRARAGVWIGDRGGFPAVAEALRSGLVYRGQAFFAWLHACFREEAEQRRLFLWLPVCFGSGVLLYFTAEREPLLWAPLVALVVSGLWARRLHNREAIGASRVMLAVAFLFAGFLAACFTTWRVSAPVIGRVTIAKTTAFVESIDYRVNGARLVLRPYMIEGLTTEQVPERVRVSTRWRPQFEAGASISATLRLMPPPVQSEPGGYDFAREAYFLRIGAVGNLVSKPVLATPQAAGAAAELAAWIDRGRNWLTARIAATIDGENHAGGSGMGAVAAALVTGKRGMIPESANEDLRAAGIYHIVSISGLHMVLAAGLFLWAMRAIFALFPGLALARPIKVWAALFAMAGASAYCIFSGSEVATQRALIMTLVMLGAVVCGRNAISMRNLAIAALLVLALDPNALLGPSFQMSFAAVAAMIAAFERRAGTAASADPWGGAAARTGTAPDQRADRPEDHAKRRSRLFARDGAPHPAHRSALMRSDESLKTHTAAGRAMLLLIAMAVTTLVASLATDPYALYHFHRITPYGLLGNMLVLPLIEFVVMPAAVLGVIAAPFGLDGPIWWLMGQGIAFMMAMAQWVASLKGSVVLLPAFGPAALLLLTCGLLWVTLWQTPVRWAGLALAVAGIALASRTPLPDLMISGQGRIAAYRNGKGVLDILNARANRFGSAQWLASDADRRKPDAPGLVGRGRCDRTGCVGRLRDGRILALALSRSALLEDCGRADIVVTSLQAAAICKGPEKVIDRGWLKEYGAARGYLQADGSIRFETARSPRTDRPWSPLPAGARARSQRTSRTVSVRTVSKRTVSKRTWSLQKPGASKDDGAGWVKPR